MRCSSSHQLLLLVVRMMACIALFGSRIEGEELGFKGAVRRVAHVHYTLGKISTKKGGGLILHHGCILRILRYTAIMLVEHSKHFWRTNLWHKLLVTNSKFMSLYKASKYVL